MNFQTDRLAARILSTSPMSSAKSGLFVHVPSAAEGSELVQHLLPTLQESGATIIHADLAAHGTTDPADVITEAIAVTIAEHQLPNDPRLVNSLATLSDALKKPIVLIIEDAPRMNETPLGRDMMFALKAARDELNITRHGLRIVFIGSDRDQLAKMCSLAGEAFYCAPMMYLHRKRYTAGELNAQCDSSAPMPADLQEWELAPSVGSEIL